MGEELTSTTGPCEPTFTWYVNNFSGTLLYQGERKLGSVSDLHHTALDVVVGKLGARMDEISREALRKLVERGFFDWRAECKVTASQHIYDEDDMYDEDGRPPPESALRKRESHCTKQPAEVQFYSSKNKLMIAVRLKKSR